MGEWACYQGAIGKSKVFVRDGLVRGEIFCFKLA